MNAFRRYLGRITYSERIAMANSDDVDEFFQPISLQELICKLLFLWRGQFQPESSDLQSHTLMNFCSENRVKRRFVSFRMLSFSTISAASMIEALTSLQSEIMRSPFTYSSMHGNTLT